MSLIDKIKSFECVYGGPPIQTIQICTLNKYLTIDIPNSLDLTEIIEKTLKMNLALNWNEEKTEYLKNDYIALPMLLPAIYKDKRIDDVTTYDIHAFVVSFQMLRIREIECYGSCCVKAECPIVKSFRLNNTINEVIPYESISDGVSPDGVSPDVEKLNQCLSVVLVKKRTYESICLPNSANLERFSFISPLPAEIMTGILLKTCPTNLLLESLPDKHDLVKLVNSKLNKPSPRLYKPIIVNTAIDQTTANSNTVLSNGNSDSTVLQKDIVLDLD